MVLIGHDVSGSKKGERYITARGTINSGYEQHHGIPNVLMYGEYSEANGRQRLKVEVSARVHYMFLIFRILPGPV